MWAQLLEQFSGSATWVVLLLAVGHSVALFGFVLVERREPGSALAWVLTLVFLPGVGLLLWLVLGPQRRVRKARRRSALGRRTVKLLEEWAIEPQEAADAVAEPEAQAMIRLGTRLATVPPTRGNSCEALIDGMATYDAMLTAIAEAADHVHVQFYIIREDEEGQRLIAGLAARAAAGVTVRAMVDHIGSHGLSDAFWAPLLEAGGQMTTFGRPGIDLRLSDGGRFDFRNHRKIVVVDGRIGFCGGINIGREYLGADREIGRWRDTHVRIEGPAVIGLQAAFVLDWHTSGGDEIVGERIFPPPPEEPVGPSVVHVIDSGPDRSWSPMRHLYLQAAALARYRLWLTSPYFVPDQAMLQALIGAALRGVDVRLLVPRRSDNRLVTWASHSYFRQLLEAGVRIYAYDAARRRRFRLRPADKRPGMVHAKTLVVDAWLATIGSTNMDLRSFELNYEIDALVYGEVFATAMAQQFERDLDSTERVRLAAVKGWGHIRRLKNGLARLLSPLL